MAENNVDHYAAFVIIGMTENGQIFRPSDWAERLAGVMSMFGDGYLSYSPYVHPISTDGIKGVFVDSRLQEIEPLAYRFLLSFARDNDLQVRELCAAPLKK